MHKNYFIFFIIFALLIGSMLYLYKNFLMDLLIASLICIATFDIKIRLDRFIKINFLTTTFSILFLLLFLVLPFAFLLGQIVVFFTDLHINQVIAYLALSKEGILRFLEQFSFLKPYADMLGDNISTQSLVDLGLKVGSYIGKESLRFFIDICFIVLFLFFLFYYGKEVYLHFLKAMPLKLSQTHKIFQEVSGVLKIVLFTSLINVVLQGFAFGILMFYCDYNNALLLGILYGISSLIPLVGGALVWIPIAGYEFYLNHLNQMFLIIIYSVVVIGFIIDNVIKPFIIGFVNKKILKKPLKLNEIIIFFAIFAGFSSFGFWGIVIGPAITAFFISLLRLYQNKILRDFDTV